MCGLVYGEQARGIQPILSSRKERSLKLGFNSFVANIKDTFRIYLCHFFGIYHKWK